MVHQKMQFFGSFYLSILLDTNTQTVTIDPAENVRLFYVLFNVLYLDF